MKEVSAQLVGVYRSISSLWHEQREREGRTRTETNRSRSTASSCTARRAHHPLCGAALRTRGSSKLIVASLKRLEELARAREGEEGGQEEEAGRTRTHLLSRSSSARPPCFKRVLCLLGPRRKASASLRVAVGVERGRSTRFADEDASRWPWAVGEGGWWRRRCTEMLAIGADHEPRPESSAQS